jgi:two-component system cell cycle response regulator CtrA
VARQVGKSEAYVRALYGPLTGEARLAIVPPAALPAAARAPRSPANPRERLLAAIIARPGVSTVEIAHAAGVDVRYARQLLTDLVARRWARNLGRGDDGSCWLPTGDGRAWAVVHGDDAEPAPLGTPARAPGGVLERENDALRDEIDALKTSMGIAWAPPAEFGLTGYESRALGRLLKGGLVSKESLMTALYSDRPDDEPQIKIVDVFICKMRRKLAGFGINIETRWGRGYELSPAALARFDERWTGARAA